MIENNGNPHGRLGQVDCVYPSTQQYTPYPPSTPFPFAILRGTETEAPRAVRTYQMILTPTGPELFG